MTTVGTATWGVILATAQSSGDPSGDICYFLCDSVDVKHNDKDSNKHVPGGHYSINTKTEWYEVSLSECRVKDNALATLNSYNALIMSWKHNKTSIYLWLKDGASSYYDFLISGSMQDYLPCTIKTPYSNPLSHNQKTMNIKVEEI